MFLLVIQAVVSYRSIPRILNLLNTETALSLGWVSHFTSLINWTFRLGLGLLKQVKPVSMPWISIIDHSIGTKKALVVLRVSMAALSQRGAAIQLEDCECIGLTVCERVNGEGIAQDLETIFNQAGNPTAIIKNGDFTLQKGVRLWSEQLTTLINQGDLRLRQTEPAFLIRPKLRSKGRCQSISTLDIFPKYLS